MGQTHSGTSDEHVTAEQLSHELVSPRFGEASPPWDLEPLTSSQEFIVTSI